MNKFQEQLQRAISGVNKVSEIVVSSDKVSQLDLDVLLEKLRNTYNIVLSFEEVEKEIIITKPVIVKEEEKEEIKEEVVVANEEPIVEKIIEQEEVVEVNEEPVIEQEQESEEVFVEEESVPEGGDKEEEIFVEEESAPVEEEPEVSEEPIEEIIEPEILFEPEIKEEPIVEDIPLIVEEPKEKPRETPSVLKYLNEQMPKTNDASQRTVAERYEQQKSIFDNIANVPVQEDVSTHLKPHNVDLRIAIGVNEKFMFINDLFSGNLREYTDFIQKLNDVQTSEKAIEILMKTKDEKRWVPNSLSFTTLKEIMIKKFH
ncbi:MAG: hypothetical protein WC679_06885 [Bacteroidales bacterium]|jgi:hypothetical protein